MTPAGAQTTAGASSSAAALLSALPADVDAAVVRDGPRFVVAAAPDALRVASGADALAALDGLPPGWWAGFLTYELGGAVEQVSPRPLPNGRDDEPSLLPDLVLAPAKIATRRAGRLPDAIAVPRGAQSAAFVRLALPAPRCRQPAPR